MKTIEEKAKAYDDLLVKLQKAKVDNNVCDERYCCVIDDIVPELKESEDERIRKAIMEFVKQNQSFTHCKGISKEKCIAWLEKQDETYNQISIPKFTFDDVLALQCVMETVKKVQEDKDLYKQLESLHNRVHDAYWLEKQSEQKPAWSEEDEDRFRNLIELVKQSDEGQATKIGFIGFLYRLRTLKDRYAWKPSEEQMQQLHNVFNGTSEGWEDSVIESLYNDLKKLKG